MYNDLLLDRIVVPDDDEQDTRIQELSATARMMSKVRTVDSHGNGNGAGD